MDAPSPASMRCLGGLRLVVDCVQKAAIRRHKLAGRRRGLLGAQEDGHGGDLRDFHHAADGIRS